MIPVAKTSHREDVVLIHHPPVSETLCEGHRDPRQQWLKGELLPPWRPLLSFQPTRAGMGTGLGEGEERSRGREGASRTCLGEYEC
jgi:hypothetical protein